MCKLFSFLRALCVSVAIIFFALAIVSSGCGRRADIAVADFSGLVIELNDLDARDHGFEIVGLSAEQCSAIEKLDDARKADLLQVFVDPGGAGAPAVLGTTRFDRARLRFLPRFPFEPGLRYRAVLRLGTLPRSQQADDVVIVFKIPKPPAARPTFVEHIYPTSDRLPENQLKFYIHFSAPMARGEAYQHIHLVGADGKAIEAPFLELGEELWDPAMRRFTLLCDPGRVKRELKPREELGPVLESGKSYKLIVDRDWLDAAGNPLDNPAEKSFDVLAPDETPVDPAAWKIEPPAANTTSDLVVRFPEPLDHSLLARVVWLVDMMGKKVEGRVEVADGETCWRFKPARAWQAGEYQLVADAALEDLAGNAIGRAFDADVFVEVQKRIESKTVALPFEIR